MLNLIPPDYTPWILSEDYIKELNFDYMETYSFNRLDPLLKVEYNELFERRRHGILPATEMARLEERDRLYNGLELLVDDRGTFHHSCEKIATFQMDDPEVMRLKRIMQMEVIECLDFLCAPYYRDGIIFYDSTGKIVSVLNVCLSCKHMTTGVQRLRADFEVYDLLKKFFLDSGHCVEEPHSFLMDQFGEKKAKFLAERDAQRNNRER